MQNSRPLITAIHNTSPDRWKLQASDLGPSLDPAELGFRTTDELEPLDHLHGQERALRALEFGLAVRHRGYNIYVSGVTGTDKNQSIQKLLEARAGREKTPDDWVYVHNFDEPDRPLALRLPTGHGVRLRGALEEVIDRLQHDLPAALKAKDFDAERERLAAKFGQQSEALFNQLVERGRQLDLMIRQLPNGVLVFIPLKDGKPIEPPDIEQLSDEERAAIERRQAELGKLAGEILTKQQELSHQLRQAIHWAPGSTGFESTCSITLTACRKITGNSLRTCRRPSGPRWSARILGWNTGSTSWLTTHIRKAPRWSWRSPPLTRTSSAPSSTT